MKLSTKFNENDSVWFLHHGEYERFMEGTIKSLKSWNKWVGFTYEVLHVTPEGDERLYDADEINMYASKEEMLEKIIEPNGTVVNPYVDPNAQK